MKKFKTLFFLLFISNIAWLQSPCSSDSFPGDSPPECVHCNGVLNSSTENFTAENFPFNYPCGKEENSQWISVRPNPEGIFLAEIKVGGCSSGVGIDVMLYTKQLMPISDCISVFNHRDGEQMEVSGLTPGERYLLLVDGQDAAACNFSIDVLTTPGMNTLPEEALIELIPNSKDVCGDSIQRFSITPVKNVDFYTWNLPFSQEVIAGGTPHNAFVDLRFLQWHSGIQFLKVTPEFSCFSGITSSISIDLHPLTRRSGQTLFICPEDLPKTIDGVWVDHFGFYDDTIKSEATGCPEIVNLRIRELELKNSILDTVICPGSCIIFNDSCYFEDTNQTISLPCLDINLLNIIHADTGHFKINCFIDSFLNSIAFDWKDLGADSNDIFINDIYHTTQSGSSFFLNPSLISGDSIIFRVVPRSILGCPFKSSEIVCAAPKTSDTYENNFEKKVRIFPNPSSDFIEIQTNEQIDELQIVDLSGKIQPIIFSKKLNISHLNSGVYFLKIRIGDDFLIRKIVVFKT